MWLKDICRQYIFYWIVCDPAYWLAVHSEKCEVYVFFFYYDNRNEFFLYIIRVNFIL